MKNKASKAALLVAGVVGCMSCNQVSTKVNTAGESAPTDLIQFVDPFIGTEKMGHVYPGATTPFGAVQLSPASNIQTMFLEDGSYNKPTYKYCAGYQHDDETIFGFAHTHFSGTGHADLGDFLVMPTTGDLTLEPGTIDGEPGFHSKIQHKNEHAEPGYYSVLLDKYDIKAELTTSDRVGFHQYTFPESDNAHIILDLIYNIYNYDGKGVWTFVRVENDHTITGYRQTNGWARNKTVYFAMEFSKPFKSYGHKRYEEVPYNGFYRRFNEEENFPEMAGHDIRAYFNFDTKKDEQIQIKFALSSVSTEGAMKNLKAEIPHWDFDQVKKESQERWNKELNKVVVESLSEDNQKAFYTSLYHTMLSPIVYEDVDGQYRGLDQNIHQSEGFTNHSIFSLWDTYRALHPLFNIIQQERNNDMIKSMIAHHDQSVHHMLPIWSHYNNENWCMIGYHATSVIADAIAKGVGDFDKERALQACINTSTVPYFMGIEDYIKYKYVPEDKHGYSVSITLEYAYNDWCIAQVAKSVGNEAVYKEYLERSTYYENVYDPVIGFMRPKLSNGEWKEGFDPMDTHGQGFIEGNAYNYGLYVPQNVDHMVEMMRGKDHFWQHLDSLFEMPIADKYIENHEDITREGIIGNYVHGNEPGHHIPYLYNWTSKPWKTQEKVRMIMDTMYGTAIDGLCGNDDAGQMSAWYIFSSLGFYPVCPGSDQYAIGSPLVKKATLHLENGKQLNINTVNQAKENVYVQKVVVNGKDIDRNYLLNSEIINGGEIVFHMANTPNEAFGVKK